jgi:hypothetical protein
MLLFALDTFELGVNVMYLVPAVAVAIVATVSDAEACPLIVVHVTVLHVNVPEPVIPLPMNSAGVLGTT